LYEVLGGGAVDDGHQSVRGLSGAEAQRQTVDVGVWSVDMVERKSDQSAQLTERVRHAVCIPHTRTRSSRNVPGTVFKRLNSLPNSVVEACSLNAFKTRLDKVWSHQDVKFDFTASLIGTGNRSERI